MMYRRSWSLCLLLWFSLCGAVAQADTREADAHFFDQTLGDLREELNTARAAGQQGLLLFFEMDECPFCARMKDTVFNQIKVQEAVKPHFLVLPIDIEGDVELVDFKGNTLSSKDFSQKLHRVRATPVMIFYDLQGETLYRHTGPTKDAQEFLWLVDYVRTGQYKTLKFSQFRQQQAP